MKELVIDARKENLEQVLSFVEGVLEETECPMKVQMKVDVAVEEIFVNIASYAYGEDGGKARILAGLASPGVFEMTFVDSGVPYNPLEKEDPDVTLPAEERPIGGLGIFLAFKVMDEVEYEYRDGQNCLTLRKRF